MTLNKTLVKKISLSTEIVDIPHKTLSFLQRQSSNKLPYLTLKMQEAQISSVSKDSVIKQVRALCSLFLTLEAISHIPCKNMEYLKYNILWI